MKQPFPEKQKNPIRPYTLIGLLLIAVLFLSTITLAYLYITGQTQQALLYQQIQETQKRLDQIHAFLAQGDLKKAFSELAQAQKNVADLLPPVTATAPLPVIARNEPPTPAPPATVPVPASKPPATTSAPKEPITVPASPLPAPAPASPTPGAAPVKSSPVTSSGRIDHGCRRKPLSFCFG